METSFLPEPVKNSRTRRFTRPSVKDKMSLVIMSFMLPAQPKKWVYACSRAAALSGERALGLSRPIGHNRARPKSSENRGLSGVKLFTSF